MYQLLHDGKIIADNIKKAESFWDRLCGLMFKESLGEFGGLLFESKSIHTHFMRFKIDVIFFDESWKVIKVFRSMKPWRITKIYFKARYVLELDGGTIDHNISEGDQLEVICIN